MVLAVGAPVAGLLAVGFVWFYFSPKHTDVGFRPKQPVPYSHALHVGKLNLDCRYCHASVEVSAVSTVPPTQVCMNCHKVIKRDSALLEPIRESAESGRPMRWIRVHNLPDYAFFNHSAHIHAGVGCATCHGAIHQMEVVTQVEPLSMTWCLDCHRDPGPHLRPRDSVTDMDWTPPKDQAEFAAQTIADLDITPPVDCSGCHR